VHINNEYFNICYQVSKLFILALLYSEFVYEPFEVTGSPECPIIFTKMGL
jgi:hypothetical protein